MVYRFIFLFLLCLSGCGFYADSQEEQYKKIFHEKRRPIYNPGGRKFGADKEFYSAYMKRSNNKLTMQDLSKKDSKINKIDDGKNIDEASKTAGMKFIDKMQSNNKSNYVQLLAPKPVTTNPEGNTINKNIEIIKKNPETIKKQDYGLVKADIIEYKKANLSTSEKANIDNFDKIDKFVERDDLLKKEDSNIKVIDVKGNLNKPLSDTGYDQSNLGKRNISQNDKFQISQNDIKEEKKVIKFYQTKNSSGAFDKKNNETINSLGDKTNFKSNKQNIVGGLENDEIDIIVKSLND